VCGATITQRTEIYGMNRNRVIRECCTQNGMKKHPHFSEYVDPYCKCGLPCAVHVRSAYSTTRACALGKCDYTGNSSTPAQQCEGWIAPLTAADLTLQQIERMTAVWQLKHDMSAAQKTAAAAAAASTAAAQREQKAVSKAAKHAAKAERKTARKTAKQSEKAVKIKLEKDVKVKLETGVKVQLESAVQVKHEKAIKQEPAVSAKREQSSNKRVKTEVYELSDGDACPATPPRKRVRVKTERAAAAAAAVGDNWVQCERDNCHKWRRIAHHVDPTSLPNQWYCNMNYWDTAKARCNVPEECDNDELDTAVAPPRLITKHEAAAAVNDDEIQDVTDIMKAQRVVHMIDFTNE
jgi:flagellar motor protein MotB